MDILEQRLGRGTIHLVRPIIENSMRSVVLLFFEWGNGSVISGGACSSATDEILGARRATSELFRHGIAATRLLSGGISPSDAYERRLHFFASGQGRELFHRRMSASGSHPVRLPSWAIRTILTHDFDDSVCVARAVLEGQTPFLGEDPRRFCL